jgi:hypothetical protein
MSCDNVGVPELKEPQTTNHKQQTYTYIPLAFLLSNRYCSNSAKL